MIGLLLLWFVTAFLHDATYFLTFRLMHLLLLFWIFYLMLLQVLHISDNNIGNLYTCLTFWLCIIFYDYYRNHMQMAEKNTCKRVLYGILIINMFSNFIQLIQDPYLSKYVTGGQFAGNVTQLNIFTTTELLGEIVLCLLFLHRYLTIKTRIRYLHLLLALCTYFTIILSSSMISIIICTCSLIGMLLYYLRQRNEQLFLCILAIFGILLLYFVINSDAIMNGCNALISSIPDEMIKKRGLEILHMLDNQFQSEITMSGRLTLYQDSLHTFLTHPFFGIGRHHSNVQGLISLHSQILDDFAYYGGIGVTFYILSIRCFLKQIRYRSMQKGACIICMLAIGFFSLMNPILSVANGLIIFVLLPLEIETGHHRIKLPKKFLADIKDILQQRQYYLQTIMLIAVMVFVSQYKISDDYYGDVAYYLQNEISPNASVNANTILVNQGLLTDYSYMINSDDAHMEIAEKMHVKTVKYHAKSSGSVLHISIQAGKQQDVLKIDKCIEKRILQDFKKHNKRLYKINEEVAKHQETTQESIVRYLLCVLSSSFLILLVFYIRKRQHNTFQSKDEVEDLTGFVVLTQIAYQKDIEV